MRKTISLSVTAASIGFGVFEIAEAQSTALAIPIVDARVDCPAPPPPLGTIPPAPPTVQVGQIIDIYASANACEPAGVQPIVLTFFAVPTLNGASAAIVPAPLNIGASLRVFASAPSPTPVLIPPISTPVPTPSQESIVLAGAAIFNSVGVQSICANASFSLAAPPSVVARTYVMCKSFNVIARPESVPISYSIPALLSLVVVSTSLFWGVRGRNW
jgi:hypothetical protein